MSDRETLRLEALKSFGVLDTQADATIDRLAHLARNLFDTPIALITLVGEQRVWFNARLGIEACATPRDRAFCARAIDLGPESVMVVEDAAADPRFADALPVTGALDLRFYVGATLTTKDGHNFGTLCVMDDKPRQRPDDAALERLRLLARIIVDEFELARAHRETREKQRSLEIAETMAGVGHWRLDLATNTIAWSDAVYDIYGVDRDTFDPNQNDTISFYHADDRELVLRHLASTVETRTGFDFQLRLIRADGALRHVVSRGVCEQDDQGRPTAIIGLFQDVTETVQTIETLRQGKKRYRLVTEHAGDVIGRYDFSGGGKSISPAIERLLGYTVAETVGLTVPLVLHPKDRNAVMAVFSEMSRGLDHKTIQHRSRHKHGRYIWVETNLQLVRDEDGAPLEIVGVSRDISDRKALELELAAARDDAREQARRALLAEDIGGLGYWRYDLRARRLDVSPKMFEIYGLACVEQPEIDLFNDRLHPDDRAWTLARIAERLRTGEDDHNVPTRIIRPDGEERCVSGSSITVKGADGLPAFMMGTVRDITEDRRAQAALAENEARYRLLADNASDMIATFNPAGEICFISPACRTVLGREPEELVGRRVVDLTHPDDREHMINYYMALIRRGPSAVSEPYEFRAQHKDGRWIWLEGQPKLSFDEAGALVSIQDVAREITARKAMQAALVEARAEAEAATAVKSEFLSNMSHELRTPLTAVLGFSRLIEEQPELSPTTRRFVDRVANAGQALMSTVNDILDFSKLEAGQVEIRGGACDPRRLVEDALDLFACQAQEKGVALDIVGAETLPPALFIAPDRVRQVLLNLIGNAVKFTDRGGVTVEAGWSQDPNRLRISVRDTGEGISADRLDQLFKRFSQIDGSSTRRQGGTGLGLAICKGLVEAMGGRIGINSVVGEGSLFWFELPADEVEQAAMVDASVQAADIPTACRVLAVDDNPVNRDLVRTVLGALGAETTEAADGEAAVILAGSEPFDVILMDLRMPGMGGVAAARAIRQSRINGNVPIIAFSADATEAPAGVFDGVIAKPLETGVLIREINRALQLEKVGNAA